MPGRGLWVELDDAMTLRLLGEPTAFEPMDLALANGWTNAANPYDADLLWAIDDIRVLRDGADIGPLSDPATWGVALPYVQAMISADHRVGRGRRAVFLFRCTICWHYFSFTL